MGNEYKILILEDDPADAELIQRMMRRAGVLFDAEVVSEEREFVDALRNSRFHVVLSDNALPQYSSLEALKIVKAAQPHMAFILVTGTVSEEFAVNIMLQGADDYVLKTNLARLPAAVLNAIEKKKVQYEVETERRLSTEIINSLPGLFFMYSNAGYMVRWNSNLQRVSGFLASEIVKMRPSDLFQLTDRPRGETWEQEVSGAEYYEREALLHTRVGAQLPFLIIVTTIQYGGEICILGTGTDMTLRKQSERELIQLTEQLRGLSQRLHHAREEEQRRIARELHDELGQHITGLRMDVFTLQSAIEAGRPLAQIQEKIAEINGLLDNAVGAIRKISSELHPSVLENLGLIAALDWQAGEFTRRFHIPVHFYAEDMLHDLKMDLSQATGVFRMFQESLTNVARHAGPCEVHASMLEENGMLCLRIEDNGKGFDAANTKSRGTLGLLGMRERAIMIGAEVQIYSEPGKGTRISIRIPLPPQ